MGLTCGLQVLGSSVPGHVGCPSSGSPNWSLPLASGSRGKLLSETIQLLLRYVLEEQQKVQRTS